MLCGRRRREGSRLAKFSEVDDTEDGVELGDVEDVQILIHLIVPEAQVGER